MKQVFLVPASGIQAFQHYSETIRKKRTLTEAAPFLPEHDLKILKGMYRNTSFAVWGARSTQGNARTFNQMNLGDYILFWQKGRIVLIGEIAWKTKNKQLAEYFWKTNISGETWEQIYFIINEHEVDIPAEQLWGYLNYAKHFVPQGFMAIDENRVLKVEQTYGGFYDVFVRLGQGLQIVPRHSPSLQSESLVRNALKGRDEERPTDHDEMQWRLIRLGRAADADVWVPKNDQGKSWEGHRFREHVLPEFKEGLDIPRTVENIDTVWRFGYQIKAAFEIEHSTSIYSGLLRLSDLKTIAPNILYPLYIVAPKERKGKVFSELQRPTFHDQLRLHESVSYLSYERIRDLDQKFGEQGHGLTQSIINENSERVA